MFVAIMSVAPHLSMCKMCVFIRLGDEYLSLGNFQLLSGI